MSTTTHDSSTSLWLFIASTHAQTIDLFDVSAHGVRGVRYGEAL